MRYLSTNLTVSTRNARFCGPLISDNQFNQLANRLTSIIGTLMICAICDIKIHTAKLLYILFLPDNRDQVLKNTFIIYIVNQFMPS